MAVVKQHEEGAALNSGHHRHRRETEENFEATALRPAIRPFGPYRGTPEKRRKKFQLNIRLEIESKQNLLFVSGVIPFKGPQSFNAPTTALNQPSTSSTTIIQTSQISKFN